MCPSQTPLTISGKSLSLRGVLPFAPLRRLTFVCLVPEFLNLRFNVPFYFGGTSLLIVVVVTMDFMNQVQAYMMSHQYENLLKKTNFKGFGSGL